MIRPIPPGTRDVLPDEMRELRAIESALLGAFEAAGFREVRTPTLEYAGALELGDGRSADAAYRFFDERGELLALRTDMTIPIARLVADRFGEVEPPHRLSYIANAYRAVTPQRGELREFGQAGVELIGSPGPEGTAEVVELLDRALAAVGLDESVIGLGEDGIWTALLEDSGAGPETIERTSELLVSHDLVGVEVALRESGLDAAVVEQAVRLTQMRGGSEVVEQARGFGGERFAATLDRLVATFQAISARSVSRRVQLDLGMLREIGYYSGSTIEVYDATVGEIIGGGGRYDDLMSKFGMDLPAAGFTLYIERIHKAQLERGGGSRRAGGGADV
ncbi:MAG: ATP phosphoribosyltransferase regulatory subunit [Solirubrobacterales bacterium]|nr:ATP phosphoribosyltransferase regulatory subunit [Solirubrobacterales bacterium]